MTQQFQEKQRFNQWWLWVLICGLTLISNYTFIQEIVFKQYIGNKGPNGIAAFLPPLIMSSLFFLFLLMKLETRIDDEGIHVRFFPIHRNWRTYPWTSISKVEVRTYRPLIEYGGWGLRGMGSNRALNVSGKTGIQLEFKNGDKLLIGTQRGDEVKKALFFFRANPS